GQILRLEGFNDRSLMGTGSVLLLTITISQIEAATSANGSTKQKKKKYTTIANRPARQKAVFLVSLALIILLGGIGLFSFSHLWTRNVLISIPYPPLIGSLALDDTLRDNTRGYNWPEDGI